MPYKSKADRERENWMTLPEAVNHICKIENISESNAREQLLAALVDGELWPLKWQRKRGDRAPPFGHSAVPSPTDTPPRGSACLAAKIRWKTGRVRDDWGEHKQEKLRLLLVHRHTVLRLWSTSKPDSTRSAQPNNPHRKAGGRPSAREQVYSELQKMRDEGKDLRLPQKKLAEKIADRKGRVLGDRGWHERTIIGHVSKWLQDNRLTK
jgi:hypothetical protein